MHKIYDNTYLKQLYFKISSSRHLVIVYIEVFFLLLMKVVLKGIS